MNIWFTSDLHLCHQQEFLWKPRGFNSVEEMNEALVENWNSVVKNEDEVWLLGDLMLNDDERGIELLKQLNGCINIIRGNHDTNNRIGMYKLLPNVCSIENSIWIKRGGYKFYLSHYPSLCANFDDNKPLRAKTINLCGHAHTKNRYEDWARGLIYHVEVDAHDNKPVSLEEIIGDLNGVYYGERKGI
jgi:calcineurin-like phosphoesterase family protein